MEPTNKTTIPEVNRAQRVGKVRDAILDVRWPDGSYDGLPSKMIATMIAEHLVDEGIVR